MLNNKPVSLCKGQNLGETSPSSGVRKNAMSPCSVQNGVSPVFASSPSKECATISCMTTVSSTEQVEEAEENVLLMIPFEVKYYVEMCNIIFSKKSSV